MVEETSSSPELRPVGWSHIYEWPGQMPGDPYLWHYKGADCWALMAHRTYWGDAPHVPGGYEWAFRLENSEGLHSTGWGSTPLEAILEACLLPEERALLLTWEHAPGWADDSLPGDGTYPGPARPREPVDPEAHHGCIARYLEEPCAFDLLVPPLEEIERRKELAAKIEETFNLLGARLNFDPNKTSFTAYDILEAFSAGAAAVVSDVFSTAKTNYESGFLRAFMPSTLSVWSCQADECGANNLWDDEVCANCGAERPKETP